jgi:hypothetical protein
MSTLRNGRETVLAAAVTPLPTAVAAPPIQPTVACAALWSVSRAARLGPSPLSDFFSSTAKWSGNTSGAGGKAP